MCKKLELPPLLPFVLHRLLQWKNFEVLVRRGRISLWRTSCKGEGNTWWAWSIFMDSWIDQFLSQGICPFAPGGSQFISTDSFLIIGGTKMFMLKFMSLVNSYCLVLMNFTISEILHLDLWSSKLKTRTVHLVFNFAMQGLVSQSPISLILDLFSYCIWDGFSTKTAALWSWKPDKRLWVFFV